MIWQTEKFVTIKQGSNDFTCLVLRDPQGRYEPSCLNTPAMKAVLPVYEYQTRKLYQGISIKHINTAITQKAKIGELPIPETGALVYMMSPNNKFYDYSSQKLLDIAPHIMHYLPKIDEGTLGFNGQHGLPAFYNEYPHLSVIHIHTDKM